MHNTLQLVRYSDKRDYNCLYSLIHCNERNIVRQFLKKIKINRIDFVLTSRVKIVSSKIVFHLTPVKVVFLPELNPKVKKNLRISGRSQRRDKSSFKSRHFPLLL